MDPIPHITKNIFIKTSDQNVISGRGYIAKQDLQPGINILNDKSLAAVSTNYNYSICFKNDKNSLRFCENCFILCKMDQMIRFLCRCDVFCCSQKCLKSLKKFHSIFCDKKYPNSQRFSPEIRLSVLLFIKSVDLSHLQSDESSVQYQNLIEKENQSIDRVIERLKQLNFKDRQRVHVDDLRRQIKSNISILFSNSFCLKLPILDDQTHGLALFNDASMFNHSCAPNCHFYFEGDQIHIFTSQNIVAGSECTISFMMNLESQTLLTRQRSISSFFGFKCICERCKVNSKYLEHSNLLNLTSISNFPTNNTQHKNLWQFACDKYENGQIIDSYKCYKRLFEKFQSRYHSFDPFSLIILDRISIISFLNNDFSLGLKCVQKAKRFADLIVENSITSNCVSILFRFSVLEVAFLLFLKHEKIQKNDNKNDNNEKNQNNDRDIIEHDNDNEMVDIDDEHELIKSTSEALYYCKEMYGNISVLSEISKASFKFDCVMRYLKSIEDDHLNSVKKTSHKDTTNTSRRIKAT